MRLTGLPVSALLELSPPEFYAEPERNYAEAWALVHYLFATEERQLTVAAAPLGTNEDADEPAASMACLACARMPMSTWASHSGAPVTIGDVDSVAAAAGTTAGRQSTTYQRQTKPLTDAADPGPLGEAEAASRARIRTLRLQLGPEP